MTPPSLKLPSLTLPSFKLSPALVTRLLQAAAGLVVLLLLIWGVHHGCHRTPAQAGELPLAPAVTKQHHAKATPPPADATPARTEAPQSAASPLVAPAKREASTPWVIIDEPPPPYLKRSAAGTP